MNQAIDPPARLCGYRKGKMLVSPLTKNIQLSSTQYGYCLIPFIFLHIF